MIYSIQIGKVNVTNAKKHEFQIGIRVFIHHNQDLAFSLSFLICLLLN